MQTYANSEIHYVVQELWEFALTAREWVDRRTQAFTCAACLRLLLLFIRVEISERESSDVCFILRKFGSCRSVLRLFYDFVSTLLFFTLFVLKMDNGVI